MSPADAGRGAVWRAARAGATLEPVLPKPDARDTARLPATAAAPVNPIAALGRRRRTVVLVGVLLGLLLGALDQTIVGTALPRIVAQLGGLEYYSWVFTAYMLTSTTAMPIVGRLSDQYGRRAMYLLGLGLFLSGSVLCGLAQDMLQLVAFRGFQGLGAGAVMSIPFAIVADLYPPAQRGKYQGLFGAVFGLASIVGPVTGGYITDHWSWRWIFYINLPIGLLAGAVLCLALPRLARVERRQVDGLGAGLLCATAVALLLALVLGGQAYAWRSPQVLGLLAAAAVAGAALVAVELRAEEPVLPVRLFGNAIFAAATLAAFLTAMAMFGAIAYVPLFVQAVLGLSAMQSGLVLMPMMLSMVLGTVIGGQLLSRWGRYRVIALGGLGIMWLGLLLLARVGVRPEASSVVRAIVVAGFGLGVTMPLFVIVVQNALPYRMLGTVTSSVQFFRSIGGTLGLAVMGSLLVNRFHAELAHRLPAAARAALPNGALAQLADPQALLDPEALGRLERQLATSGGLEMSVVADVLDATRLALAAALHDVFVAGLVVVTLALLVSALLREIPLRRSHDLSGAPAGREAGAG